MPILAMTVGSGLGQHCAPFLDAQGRGAVVPDVGLPRSWPLNRLRLDPVEQVALPREPHLPLLAGRCGIRCSSRIRSATSATLTESVRRRRITARTSSTWAGVRPHSTARRRHSRVLHGSSFHGSTSLALRAPGMTPRPQIVDGAVPPGGASGLARTQLRTGKWRQHPCPRRERSCPMGRTGQSAQRAGRRLVGEGEAVDAVIDNPIFNGPYDPPTGTGGSTTPGSPTRSSTAGGPAAISSRSPRRGSKAPS